jgi:hypothetical protein
VSLDERTPPRAPDPRRPTPTLRRALVAAATIVEVDPTLDPDRRTGRPAAPCRLEPAAGLAVPDDAPART